MSGISILIPCFNSCKYIEATLSSVVSAMDEHDEIIVVDDHSTDGSAQLAGSFLDEAMVDYTISTNPQKGACSARNHAFQLSNGNIIQWLDADDLIEADKFSKQRHHLNHEEFGLVVSPFQPFTENPKDGWIEENRLWDFPPHPTPADWLASGQMTIPACWLGHRRLFEKAGPWDESLMFNQDGEYFARVLACAEKLCFEPETKVWYRRGVQNSVSQFSPAKAESMYRSIESIHQTALLLEDSARMRQMIANRYQQAIYTAYPHCPTGEQRAINQLKLLPSPNIENPIAISVLSKLIVLAIGWKALTRLRILRNRIVR